MIILDTDVMIDLLTKSTMQSFPDFKLYSRMNDRCLARISP